MTLQFSTLLWLLGIGTAGWVFGAFAIGLWWGECGRRRAAERMVTFGTPREDDTQAISRRPAKEAEDRIAAVGSEITEEMVDRVVEDLKKQANAQGIEGVTDEQFREDARLLLAGQDVMPRP